MRERAGLVRMIGRPHLVRPAELDADEREPEMRPEELVGRAEEHVDAELDDVDRAVRAEVHGVGPRERAGVVRELDDPARVCQRADRVRRERERDDARPLGQLPLEVVEVERRVVVQLDEADLQVEVVCELEPRRNVSVVVEARDEDLVPGAQRAADGAREHEVECRHVLAEDRLGRIAVQERASREPRLCEERVALPACSERAAEVRVRLAQIVRDRVDHRIRALCPSWSVEERGRTLQRGEAGADGFDVEGDGAHRSGRYRTTIRA